MAKKKGNLNLNNPKQRELINTFAISEGRVSKQKIFEIGNKELFYRMKSGGFIQETHKGSGVFKSTAKLQRLTERTTGIRYGNGCSNAHSEKIGKAVSFLPKEVVSEGRFSSGQMMKQEMEHIKESTFYTKALWNHQKQILSMKKEIEDRYHSGRKDFQSQIDYKVDMDEWRLKKEIAFSDSPVFIPDFKAEVTREEAQWVLQQMEERKDSLLEGEREERYLEANIGKIQQMLSTEQEVYEIYFEAVTNYGKREMERHFNYETLLHRDVLYIY